MKKPRVIADCFIPFLRGRLDPYTDIEYVHPDAIDAATVKDADALLIRTRTRCGAPLLDGSSVRFIASGTIGMDQFDLPWCNEHGIECHNSPGCNAPGVAQYVWSCILHLRLKPSQLTIGVVGHGNVGSIVAEWGRHLGARVLLCDPPKARQGRVGYIPLEELLEQSDVVSLHVPLTHTGEDATYHLINAERVGRMKPGALLINAARGAVIDTPAVVEAMRSRSLRAVIDCWEGEPDHLDTALLKAAEIATPHIAGYSLEGKQRATRMILENFARFFSLPLSTSPDKEGIRVWDLPTPYRPVPGISAYEIISSYDPLADDALLRRAPSEFEWERDHYIYRSEPQYASAPADDNKFPALRMRDALEKGDVATFIDLLRDLLRRVPYQLRLNYEQDFQKLIHTALLLAGMRVEAEKPTAQGRIDMLIYTSMRTYIVEFKRNKDALRALEQIRDRDYTGILHNREQAIELGINFNAETRSLDAWAVVNNKLVTL